MEIGAALSSLSATLGLAKSALEARDEAKIKAALADFNEKHLALYTAALHLAEKLATAQTALGDLQREAAELRAQRDDRARYALYEVKPGHFAYRSTPSADRPNDPPHYLCQTCYDKGVKSVLHVIHDAMLGTTFECLNDKQHTFYA